MARRRWFGDAGPGFSKPQPKANQPPQLEHSQEAEGCPPRAYPSRRPALFLPREKVSSPGAAGWVGVARSSGNRPKAPPLPASPPTARPPARRAQALLPETARIGEHCLCTTRSSREVESEEEGRGGEGGERDAPLHRQVPALGSCPSVFNPLRL